MKKLNINFAGKNRRIPALFVAAALALVVIAGITFARYVLQKEHSGVAEAEAFYFTSDLLKEEAENKTYYIDPETKNFDVIISNAADSKRVTKENIAVDVAVVGGTAGDSSYTLTGGSKMEQKVTITPSADAEVVTVTAISGSPYTKTLKAEFRLASGNQYKVEDAAGSRAAVLTITCVESLTGGIAISVPENVIPDATNTLIKKNADGSYQFTPSEAGVYSLVLLKKEPTIDISKAEGAFDATNQITIGTAAAAP